MKPSSKKTAIIGASTNPSRYSYMAAGMLTEAGIEIVPIGVKRGEVFGQPIMDIHTKPVIKGLDTVTLYIGPRNQPPWYDYLLALQPRRIIFNPGTENEEFMKRASQAGIEVVEACTLVMLRTRQY